MVDPPPVNPSVPHPNLDGSVYEDIGLVIDTESAVIESSRSTIKERSARYEEKVPANLKEGKAVPKNKPAGISNYNLYKCSGCGKMVMGFDMENHVQTLHLGDEQRFVRL